MNSIEETFARLIEVGASDLLMSCGSPPRIRRDGRVEVLDPNDEPLTPAEAERLLKELLAPADWKFLQRRKQVDFAFTWRDAARVRGNAYFQRDSLAAGTYTLSSAPPPYNLGSATATVSTGLSATGTNLALTAPGATPPPPSASPTPSATPTATAR